MHARLRFLCLPTCLTGEATTADWKYAGKKPTTDKGWQAWLQNAKPPEERDWVALGGGLTVCLEVGGGKVFQGRPRRIGDKNARRIAIGHFPACSVAEARQRVSETRSAAKEGRDPALARRRAREGVEEIATFGARVDLYLARRAEGGSVSVDALTKPLPVVLKLMCACSRHRIAYDTAKLEPRPITSS